MHKIFKINNITLKEILYNNENDIDNDVVMYILNIRI